jgi:lysophospholipase L1-like esterase
MKKLYDGARFNRMKKRVFIILFGSMMLTVLLSLLSVTSARSELVAGECSTENKEIFSILPRNVEGYEKTATFKSFSPINLFEYVNGNAYYYFDHGFVCLGIQEYRKDNSALMLEIYQFTNRNGAREIFLDETAGNKNKLNIGEDGSFEDCYLAFYLKNYFVKLMCFDDWQGNGAEDESQHNTLTTHLVELTKSIEAVLIERAGENLASNKKEENVGQGLDLANNHIVLIGASYAKGWSLEEIAGMTVINKGISGEQSFEMLSRFQEDVISLKPKAVIIWGFINDIFRSKREEIDSTIERAKKSFKEMVKLSQENGIIPILATEVTIRPKEGWKETIAGWVGWLMGKKSYQDYINQQVLDMNQWLKNYAKENNLLILDLQPVISGKHGKRMKEYATNDGSHISKKGYERLTLYARGILAGYLR